MLKTCMAPYNAATQVALDSRIVLSCYPYLPDQFDHDQNKQYHPGDRLLHLFGAMEFFHRLWKVRHGLD